MPACSSSLHARQGILELDRGVTEVEADAEMAPQRGRGGDLVQSRESRQARSRSVRVQVLAEEPHRLVDGLEQAAGLGLQREHDATPGGALERHEMCRVAQQLLDDQRHCLRTGGVCLECTGHRADAAGAI